MFSPASARNRFPLRTCCGALIAAFLLATASAWAHHSHQNYFRGEFTHMEGTITEVHWMNPHIGLLSVLHAESKCYSLFLLDL